MGTNIFEKIKKIFGLKKTKTLPLNDIEDDNYKDYLHSQIERTLLKKNTNSNERVKYLMNAFKNTVNPDKDPKIISIGCRNAAEISAFKSLGFEHVIGIDLYSEDKSILLMDMHDIKLPENTFDVIYSSHSLEHSKDPEKVLRECGKIAKDGAYFIIEVPVNYPTSKIDIQDFKNLKTLYGIIEKNLNVSEKIFGEEISVNAGNNFSGTDIIRAIFKITKD